MAFDERAFFLEKPETRQARYQCPKCRRTARNIGVAITKSPSREGRKMPIAMEPCSSKTESYG